MSAVKLLTSQNEFDFMLIKCEAAAAYKAAAFILTHIPIHPY